ncbi:hypothetical protein PMM47T1_17815 [Pseudomonas sp. M47T1]|uniref:DUF3077 domain-containing protein n=1 Tax=unclassified Pseudomonas TaxID=196821 RepID=UPI00026067FC|nr:DUF3077 domain-containing protein [Pseudomonas sp. M47T1]EIK95376.1 hypothetical protein PMM47T1_17815 [Pseudomonas sp. M47T1]
MQDETMLLTQHLPFCPTANGVPLFSVQPGIPVHEALAQASVFFGCAELLAAENCDADLQLSRSLGVVTAQLVQLGKALVDASIDRLEA